MFAMVVSVIDNT